MNSVRLDQILYHDTSSCIKDELSFFVWKVKPIQEYLKSQTAMKGRLLITQKAFRKQPSDILIYDLSKHFPCDFMDLVTTFK